MSRIGDWSSKRSGCGEIEVTGGSKQMRGCIGGAGTSFSIDQASERLIMSYKSQALAILLF